MIRENFAETRDLRTHLILESLLALFEPKTKFGNLLFMKKNKLHMPTLTFEYFNASRKLNFKAEQEHRARAAPDEVARPRCGGLLCC